MTNRDAINLLEEVKILDDTMYAYNPKYLDALDMALNALEAEERKTGKWIQRNPQNSTECRLLTCSECGRSYIVGFNVQYDEWVDSHKFCINCGARLVQEGEDNVQID